MSHKNTSTRHSNGMRAHLIRQARWPLERLRATSIRCASTQSPPPARPYRPQTEEQRAALRKPEPEPEPVPQSRTRQLLSRYLNPFHEPPPLKEKVESATAIQQSQDPERGIAATQRVVKQGILDPRYRAFARRYLGIIIGSVIAIGLTPEVWRRTMRGEKRKEVPRPKDKTEGAQVEEGKSEP